MGEAYGVRPTRLDTGTDIHLLIVLTRVLSGVQPLLTLDLLGSVVGDEPLHEDSQEEYTNSLSYTSYDETISFIGQ